MRVLTRSDSGISANELLPNLSDEEIRKIRQMILRYRGEILFARVIILCEGATEEKLIPAMFKNHFEASIFSLGVSCIGVGGCKSYPPFIQMGISFGIPVYIISDSETETKNTIKRQIKDIEEKLGAKLCADLIHIEYHTKKDIEAELIRIENLVPLIHAAFVQMSVSPDSGDQHRRIKEEEYSKKNTVELLKEMRKGKTSYSYYLAEQISTTKSPVSLPKSVLATFKKIEKILKWKTNA